MKYEIHHSDCLSFMRGLPSNHVDAIVTDPPYGLSFMGKKWDYDVPSEDIWRECLRVLKPGGHLLAFAGTRTQHRMAVRIEDAGFEIRDMIAWVYGSGFPKSLDVSKAIDKAAGAEPIATGAYKRASIQGKPFEESYSEQTKQVAITAPATPEARQWHGWGTALKPALEPITVARKPLVGTVAENVLTWGTGGVNVDGCRIASSQNEPNARRNKTIIGQDVKNEVYSGGWVGTGKPWDGTLGRWPANLIHDGSEEVVGLFPETKTGDTKAIPYTNTQGKNVFGKQTGIKREMKGDSGSAARFFYCAKASKRDRDEGCEGMEAKAAGALNMRTDSHAIANNMNTQPRTNHHPTVKPTDLMRYLCRLVTPPNGLVFDPFMGSGSTGKAALLEGFDFIGCDMTAEYVDIARARIEHALNAKPNRLF